MALAQSLPLLSPSLPIQFPSLIPKRCKFLYEIPLRNSSNGISMVSCSSQKSTPSTGQEVLKFVAESDEKTRPCVRTYENDLARLSLVGAVGLEQALTAAAADGGRAAGEHVDSGVPVMVVETVLPGAVDKHATVSTRLFLPARKVKEKANKLRMSISDDILSGSSSRNILAMTFRQVVLQKLWNFELVLLIPGVERNMDDLQNPREQVPASFVLRSSDERVISVLAEVACMCALQNTERQFLDDLWGRTSSNFFQWFRKHKRIVSKDSSVVLYKLFEDEIVENAKSLLESFNSTKENFNPSKRRQKEYGWTPSVQSKLEKIGGSKFSAWTSEYIPAYQIQIDASRFEDMKLEGWRKSSEDWWEVLLTHSQMVGLADILDMYYEDIYSLPYKQLQCGVLATQTTMSNTKGSSFLKFLSTTLVSGIFLITFSVIGQFCFSHPQKGVKYPGGHRSLPSSEIVSMINQRSDSEKLETFCISVVQKIKDSFGWRGDIITEASIGAWIGEIPAYLKKFCHANSSGEESISADLEKIDPDIKSTLQEVATYQVVMSTEGKIVGFQPTNRVGVNRWASNPLAKELYGGRKLSPGFFEPGLKIRRPNEVAVMELLMSVNSDSCFALARPIR
ncbi:hypothetical protein SLE2022_011300 [Rubroshorea leprosula]